MSRNALILEKADLQSSPAASLSSVAGSGEYLDLICRALRNHSVLAVIGAGSGARTGAACRGIAAELATSGKRVVIAKVSGLFLADNIPGAPGCLPGHMRNVWLWPSTSDNRVEFFQSRPHEELESDWLGSLARDFDVVLLDCPTAAELIAPAGRVDAAVLVVDAGRTDKQQIRRTQHALELAEIKLAGCILMRRR